MLAGCRPLPVVEVTFHEALGRVLAEEITAEADDPPAPKSAMDGFALRAAETRGTAPERPTPFAFDEVVGAGRLPRGKAGEGRAVRIMTGALLPEGADAVVKQEDTHHAGEGRFEVLQPLTEGENVVAAGARIAKGERMFSEGDLITPAALGLLAGLGRSRLRVRKRPRVALLAVGDELVEVGQPLTPGRLHVSNLYALAALVARYGGEPVPLGIAGDDPEAIESRLRPVLPLDGGAAEPCDIALTLGGSHRGDFDFAHRVLESVGADIHFRRTRINLGGSTLFATLGATLLFGLPGTPVPSWGAFELLVRPALWKLAGRTHLEHPVFQARLTQPLAATAGRTCFAPAWLAPSGEGPPAVTPLKERGESGLPPSLLANALIQVPEGKEELAAETLVAAAWLGG